MRPFCVAYRVAWVKIVSTTIQKAKIQATPTTGLTKKPVKFGETNLNNTNISHAVSSVNSEKKM